MTEKKDLNLHASAYENTFCFHDENIAMLSSYADKIVNAIAKYPKANILSLGIGHRVVCQKIFDCLNTNSHYSIVEGSLEIIQKAGDSLNLNSNIHIHHNYFEQYEPGREFNIIEIGFVLEHVDEPLEIVKKYKQYLSRNGRMFIAVPNARSLHRLIGQKAGLLDNLFQLSDSDKHLGHQRYFDYDSITDLITQAGLKIESIEGLYLKPFTTSQISSLNLSENIRNALCLCAKSLPQVSNGILVEVVL
jgi:hypothetical protein